MKKLLVALVVLLVLLVAADRVAVRVADRALATQLDSQLGTTPTVHVRGFPFLTQAVAGRYRDIEVTAPSVTRSGLTLDGVSASLHGVHVPLSAALGGSVASVPVDRLAVSGVVPYTSLQSRAEGLTLTQSGEAVRVSGSIRVLGRDLSATALATATLDGRTLVLRAGSIQVDGVPVADSVANALTGRLDLRIDLSDLPYGVQVTSVRATPAGVAVTGTATGTVLTR